MDDFTVLAKYWERSPPLHQLARAWIGYKGPEPHEQGDDMAKLVAAFGLSLESNGKSKIQ